MSTQPGDDICPLCSETIELYAIGQCDHPVCYRCSTRMRVLCEHMYCAICRTDLPKVMFIRQRREFSSIATHSFPIHRKCMIYFENEDVQTSFSRLLEHRCIKCSGNTRPFRSFAALKEHVRKEHSMYYCDLCLKNIKVFSHERRCYDRKKLAEHRRQGDEDDKSHKGHPLCHFCDERYFDNDQLVAHLRKQHYYCHFCEADGVHNEFFEEYSYLREHFATEHFLCEEEECAYVEFTNAFRTEIDLRAHKASDHSRSLRKAAAKQARRLDIDFAITGGPSSSSSRGRGSGRGRGMRRDQADRQGVITADDYEEVQSDNYRRSGNPRGRERRQEQMKQREELMKAQAMSASLSEMQSKGHVNMIDRDLLKPLTSGASQQKQVKGEPKAKFEENIEDFPDLDGKVREKGSSDEDDSRLTEASTRSMAKTFALANNFSVQDGSMAEEDFPSLGGGKVTPSFNPANRKVAKTPWVGTVTATDYPELPTAAKAKPAHQGGQTATWKSSASSQPASKPQAKPQKPAMASSQTPQTSSLSDFPSLSSIGGSLATPGLGNSKTSNNTAKTTLSSADSKWLQKNTSSGEPKKKASKSTESEEFVFPKKTAPKVSAKQFTPKDADFPTLGGDSKEKKRQPDNKAEVKSSPKVNKKSKAQGKSEKAASDNEEYPALGKGGNNTTSKDKKSVNETAKQELDAKHPSKDKNSPKPPKKSSGHKNQQASNSDSVSKPWLNENPRLPESSVMADKDFPLLGSANVKPADVSWGPQKGKSKKKKKGKGNHIVETDSGQPSPYHSEGENDVPKRSPVVDDKSGRTGLDSKASEAAQDDRHTAKAQGADKDVVTVKDTTALLRDQSNMPKDPTSASPLDLKLEDFPSLLSQNRSPPAPPPGFSKPTAPPPGFKPSAGPPPGFSNVPKSQLSLSDNLQLTPEVQETKPKMEFLQPNNFQLRNQQLIQDIQDMCGQDGDKFSDFRSSSGEYRQGRLGAKEYFSKCVEVLGAENFQKVLPELLVLLPDIDKQQELLAAYRNHTSSSNNKVGKKGNKKRWNSLDVSFKTCMTCQQVLASEDYNSHLSMHNLDAEFPVLGAPGFGSQSLGTLA